MEETTTMDEAPELILPPDDVIQDMHAAYGDGYISDETCNECLKMAMSTPACQAWLRARCLPELPSGWIIKNVKHDYDERYCHVTIGNRITIEFGHAPTLTEAITAAISKIGGKDV